MNTGIEHELRKAVEARSRPNLDDIDARDLLEELASLRRDAERYRWIRSQAAQAGEEVDELDRTIDSARNNVQPNHEVSGGVSRRA